MQSEWQTGWISGQSAIKSAATLRPTCLQKYCVRVQKETSENVLVAVKLYCGSNLTVN